MCLKPFIALLSLHRIAHTCCIHMSAYTCLFLLFGKTIDNSLFCNPKCVSDMFILKLPMTPCKALDAKDHQGMLHCCVQLDCVARSNLSPRFGAIMPLLALKTAFTPKLYCSPQRMLATMLAFASVAATVMSTQSETRALLHLIQMSAKTDCTLHSVSIVSRVRRGQRCCNDVLNRV